MTLRSFVLAAATSLLALEAIDSRGASSDSDIAIISQYVTNHRHWSAKSFRVERKDCDCAYALYRVIYLPEDGKAGTAGSKSFAIYYDEQLHKIVKETEFQ
jgi:hypothetical protein